MHFKVIGTSLPHVVQVSPNYGERKDGKSINCLVLHYTGMRSSREACDWLCNEASHVSSHYLIDEFGGLVHMVDESKRAWHAGVSTWFDEDDINSTSIGIEIHNLGHHGYSDFPEQQMQTVVALCQDILKRNSIAQRLVLAHSDIAPGRKVDPGEKFNWRMLHQYGVGHWVEPEPISGGSCLQLGDEGDTVMALQAMLKLYGYGIAVDGKYDQRSKVVVEAFQRHFRPALVDGIADQSTIATLHRLLRR
jgi:N-acetylmuramoyl-L-alanine amidase